MGKVLDISQRILENKDKSHHENEAQLMSDVVDMTEARNEILSQERRQVKRTILTEFIGASVVVPKKGLLKVRINDISDTGISFDIDEVVGQFHKGEEIAMRVYLNHRTYFAFSIKVENVRVIAEEGVIRHGSHFVKGTLNDEALFHFVKFIESVSASLCKDTGDVLVSGIS